MNDQKYADITKEDFDKRLQGMIEDNTTTLLHIPGLYEVVSEFFNNDIIEEYEEENDHFLDYDTVNQMFCDSFEDCQGRDIWHTIDRIKHKVNDDIMLREDYNNYTDMLCKDGQISDFAYNNWDNPF